MPSSPSGPTSWSNWRLHIFLDIFGGSGFLSSWHRYWYVLMNPAWPCLAHWPMIHGAVFQGDADKVQICGNQFPSGMFSSQWKLNAIEKYQSHSKYFKYIKIYKLSQKIGDSAATKPQASPASSEEVVTASDRICCRQRQLNYGPQSCYHRHLDRPMSWLIHQPRSQQMHLMRPETVSHFETYPPLKSCHHQHGDSPKSPPIHQPGLQRRSLLSNESAAHCWAALEQRSCHHQGVGRGSPHVTTDLSARMAANAALVAWSCCTLLRRCWTGKTSQVLGMPHVTADPSIKIVANAELVAWTCCTLLSCFCTAELSPPKYGSPHVTTDPSLKIAANASVVAWTCCTPLSWCRTEELSPPDSGLPHVMTDPSAKTAANA